jgi:hypothetical protein
MLCAHVSCVDEAVDFVEDNYLWIKLSSMRLSLCHVLMGFRLTITNNHRLPAVLNLIILKSSNHIEILFELFIN